MSSKEDDSNASDVREADADVVTDLRPPSARTPLSRDRIVDASLSFIDEHGVPALTMRRLGNELGVEAMALYRYVPGKEELLDGVVESLIDAMRQDDEVLDTPRDGWQDFLVRLAHGVRRVAIEHPKAFPLVASRAPEAPWLRPPLCSLAWVEIFLSGLIAEGFTPQAAVDAYRAYSSVLLGHLLLEVSNYGADVEPFEVLDDGSSADAAVRDYPLAHRLRAELSQDRAAAEFEDSLEALLDRMARSLAEYAG